MHKRVLEILGYSKSYIEVSSAQRALVLEPVHPDTKAAWDAMRQAFQATGVSSLPERPHDDLPPEPPDAICPICGEEIYQWNPWTVVHNRSKREAHIRAHVREPWRLRFLRWLVS